MRASGITPSQLVLLRLLDEEGERSAGQIAQAMGITQATTTGLVHKLEARGLIERKRGETDKRQVWLSLTSAGHAALSQSPDGVHERFEQAFENLSDWEQSMLIASLERTAAMLDGGKRMLRQSLTLQSLHHFQSRSFRRLIVRFLTFGNRLVAW